MAKKLQLSGTFEVSAVDSNYMTVRVTSNRGVYSADKTYSEILSAYLEGKLVIVLYKVNNSPITKMYAATARDPVGIWFREFLKLENSNMRGEFFCSTSDVWTYTETEDTDGVKPVIKTDDMTQPVGIDENGQLWTAPTAEAEEPDILLGTLPMTINESNCYLLSETDATISTGGAEQLLDFDVSEPYIGETTYNGGAFEKIGKNTLKVSFADTAKNAAVYFPLPLDIGKNYTAVARVVEHSADIAASTQVLVRCDVKGSAYAQLSMYGSGAFAFKTFDMREGAKAYISLSKNSAYVVGETYVTVEVRIYEGEYTEIPTGATFNIVSGEKYNTDGYIGSTLTAVNGETVEVYKTNTSEAETETDTGGVIFFGDSILDFSGVPELYAAKTGKAVLDCAVGGTRMSGSRDSANEFYPYDMANIADAIASGDFSAQTSGGKNANFTVLASANIANYKAIVLEFGTNDFTAKVPFDGTDATSIKGALKHILTAILTKYPNMRIVVLSTLQYVTIGSGAESGVPTHDNGTVWQMNEVIKGVCESDEFCVPFVDMYHAFGQNAITRNTLNSDGVHLTLPNGAKRYVDILTAKLNSLGI